MGPTVCEKLGQLFAGLYGGYALLLLLAFPFHLLVAAALALRLLRPRFGWPCAHLAVDLVYGLLNPGLYLLVFDRLVAGRAPSTFLTRLGAGVLLAFWVLRLSGRGWARAQAVSRAVLLLSVATITAFAVRDRMLGSSLGDGLGYPGISWYAGAPLYLVPLLSGMVHLQAIRAPGWEASPFLLPWARRLRAGLGVVMLVSALASVAVAHWRPSEQATRDLVLAHRSTIIAASERYGIDPATLAALVFTTHREHATPFRLALEEMAMAAWLTDRNSHDGLSLGLDVSIGLAQIKPVTALAASVHWARCGDGWRSKEHRDFPNDPPRTCFRTTNEVGEIVQPPLGTSPGKAAMVDALRRSEDNLAFAAFLLASYATQWESVPGAARIRHRPEILATLYQIGIAHSDPKPAPTPNRFGRQVLEASREPWLLAAFAPVQTRR